MDRVEPQEYAVFWTGEALDLLQELVEGTRHAEGNPDWVERKFQECVAEGLLRLSLFPDLRIRYTAKGFHCNAITLRALPIQAFFRVVEPGVISIFDCQWASQDQTGPRDFGQD
jgi:hypothetical protein